MTDGTADEDEVGDAENPLAANDVGPDAGCEATDERAKRGRARDELLLTVREDGWAEVTTDRDERAGDCASVVAKAEAAQSCG